MRLLFPAALCTGAGDLLSSGALASPPGGIGRCGRLARAEGTPWAARECCLGLAAQGRAKAFEGVGDTLLRPAVNRMCLMDRRIAERSAAIWYSGIPGAAGSGR